MENNATSAFCSGDGMVMFNGFQSAWSHPTCLKFLFSSATVDTLPKYIFSVLGSMVLSIFFEGLKALETQLAENASHKRVKSTLLYLIHMFIAYCIMLLVMTYEPIIFTAILLGLAMGHFFFFPRKQEQEPRPNCRNIFTPCCTTRSMVNSDSEADFFY